MLATAWQIWHAMNFSAAGTPHLDPARHQLHCSAADDAGWVVILQGFRGECTLG